MQKLKCCLIQYDVVWENKVSNLSYLEEVLKKANPVDSAIFLPEMFNTGFSMNANGISEEMDGNTFNWMKETAQKFNSLVAGSIAIKENGMFFNRFLWCFPNGTFKYYDKKHLFRIAGEEKVFSCGNHRLIMEYKGFRFMPAVCYDLRFPVWLRNKNEYDVLVCCANWPTGRKDAWDTLLKARAIENQAYVLGINRIGKDPDCEYSGGTQVINFKGECILSAEEKACIISCELDIESLNHFRNIFPVWKDMDSFTIDRL